MTLLSYLYRRFMPVFIGALSFFSLVLILVELLMNLWQFISAQVPAADIVRVMLLYVPKTVSFALPLAILFASSYVLSDFYAKNELTAVFASGVSLFRFTLPLLVFSVVLSAFMFFFEDRVVVPAYAQKTELQQKLLNQEKSKNNDRIVVIAERGAVVYKADFYDDQASRLFTLYAVVRNGDKSLRAVLRADSAVWNGSSWTLSGAVQYTMRGDTLIAEDPDPEITALLTEPPETFRNNTVSVETVTASEARSYITHLRRAGLPTAEALSQYYKKFSFPFVVFIVVFLSVGLSGKTRKNVLLISLVLCIGAAVAFYVTQMVTMLLAKFGYISPLAGAWFPVILFIFLSGVLLKFART